MADFEPNIGSRAGRGVKALKKLAGGGAVASVANSDGTLTISPTTGSVVASIALGHANTWSGQQTFVAPILGTPASGTLTNATGLPAASVVAGALANGMTATTQSAGDNTTKLATDQFVTTAIANAIAGVNPAVAVQAATTAAADTSAYVYNNGVSGIGATLTGPTNNVAVTIDGFTFTALGQRLLVKDDTQSPSGAFNGVYYVTQLQALALKPILTRALDYDSSSDINNTGAIPVVNGTANALTSWLLTSTVSTVGTDPLTYSKFSLNPTALSTANLTDYITGSWTPADGSGAGLTITVSTATYTAIGNFVKIQFNITWPATVDTSNAAIQGLPFTVSTAASWAVIFFSGSAGQLVQANLTNNKLFFFNISTGVRLKNSDLSGQSGLATLFYQR